MFKLFILITLLTSNGLCAKLRIDILFEALCYDSLNFINYQLEPAWEHLQGSVELKLIPFGKSKSSPDRKTFTCQHGFRECEGNRVMSCALNSLKDSNAQVKFVVCFMNVFRDNAYKNRTEFGQSCVKDVGLDWDTDIKECYDSNLGTNLQLMAENETLAYQLTYIPSIVYNKIFDEHLLNVSLNIFQAVACQLARQSQPKACEKTW